MVFLVPIFYRKLNVAPILVLIWGTENQVPPGVDGPAEVSHGVHRRSFRPGWLGWISAVYSGSWWQGQRFLGRLDPKLCGEAYLAIFLLVLRDYRRFQRKRCESRKTTKSMHSSLWRLRNYVEMLWHWKRKREDETSGLPHCHGRSGYRMIQNDT